MKKIMHILFLSCLKATEIIEKRLYFRLSFKEKLQLKVHKVMCNACTLYEKQSLLIDKTIESIHKTETEQDIEPAKEEIDALKKRIIDKFSDHNESD